MTDDRADTGAEYGSEPGPIIQRATTWLAQAWDNPVAINSHAVALRLADGEEIVRLLLAEVEQGR